GASNEAGSLGADGRFYAQYPPALPLALAPLVALGRLLEDPAADLRDAYPYGAPASDAELGSRFLASYLNGPVTAGGAALLALLALRLEYRPRAAAFAAFAYGLASMAWGQARVVFPEPLQGLLLLVACHALLGGGRGRALLGGAALGLALLVKATSGLGLLLLLLPDERGRALWKSRRQVALVLAPVAAGLAIYGLYNLARFGSLLSTGYYSSGGGGLDFGG